MVLPSSYTASPYTCSLVRGRQRKSTSTEKHAKYPQKRGFSSIITIGHVLISGFFKSAYNQVRNPSLDC